MQHSAQRCGELGKVMIGRNVGCASASAGARNHTARFVTLNPHVDYPGPPTTSCGIPPAALGRTANPSTTNLCTFAKSGEYSSTAEVLLVGRVLIHYSGSPRVLVTRGNSSSGLAPLAAKILAEIQAIIASKASYRV